MKRLAQRLVVFFIGIPALLGILFLLPYFHHLAFSVVVITVSVMGAVEFAHILSQKGLSMPVPEAAILGGLAPFTLALVVSFGIKEEIFLLAFCLAACWILFSRIFSGPAAISAYANRSAASFSVLIYPGLLMSWIVKMAALEYAGVVIFFYLLITFLNDAAAWLTGMLFGKNNRGIVAASPNKSAAGFAGGLASSIALGVIGAAAFPAAFEADYLPRLLSGAVLGLLGGGAAILGDLGESALKRSANVKDSGTIIMGRGGMLDCIDSLALAAPVYYLAYKFLF